jgi:hypothetical protein
MTEFEIEGKFFRIEKLTAMQQFHVSRKIAPLIPPLLPIFAQVAKDQKKGVSIQDDFEVIGPLLQPFADGLSTMSDEASEYVFGTCLGALRYKHGDNWITFWSKTGNVAMVHDMNDVGLLIRLVVRVISDSLSPFIGGFLTNAEEAQEPALRSVPSPEKKTG